MPNSPFISCKPPLNHVYSSPSCHHKVIPLSIHQTSTNGKKARLNLTLSPSLSLKQRSLAQARRSLTQASSPRLGEGSKYWNSGSYAVSLRRDPPRLSEMLAHSKWVGRLSNLSCEKTWASLCSSRLGEASSLGRDYQSPPTVHLQNRQNQAKQSNSTLHKTHRNIQNIKSYKSCINNQVTNDFAENPNFPYLEKG